MTIPGDVPALGKLVIDNDSAGDWSFLMWGVQSRWYDSSADAALAYSAESRTPLGTSATATGATGAVGTAPNVIRNSDLIPSWLAVMSTQASGGNHMRQIGSFRIWARTYRPTSNTGEVSIRLSWSEGDFRRFTSNDSVTYPVGDREGSFVLTDLGLVTLSKAAQGTQQWQGRIEARSTVVGDEIDIDQLWLMPAGEGYGEVRSLLQFESPTSVSARDEFNQSAGNLAGKTAPVGGTWAGLGDADDFTVETTGKTAQRSRNDDTTSPRIELLGTATFTDTAVQADVKMSAIGNTNGDPVIGVVARTTDASNYLMAGISNATPGTSSPNWRLIVEETLAGVSTILFNAHVPVPQTANTYFSIRLSVDAAGRWTVWLFPQGRAPSSPVARGVSATLATGGGLASGRVGLRDVWANGGVGTCVRNYDNVLAFVPAPDAAVFAGQSLELRHDRVLRENSAGTIWSQPSKYEGSYLLVPPSGREGRTVRFIVKPSRGDPDTGTDSAIDDISARLTVTPRGLEVPDGHW